jgi:hypothetical protein
MTYELAKQLKDARFPQDLKLGDWCWEGLNMGGGGPYKWQKLTDEVENLATGELLKIPTLSELIAACGAIPFSLKGGDYDIHYWWIAEAKEKRERGESPEEAVAKLWLALHQNKCRLLVPTIVVMTNRFLSTY